MRIRAHLMAAPVIGLDSAVTRASLCSSHRQPSTRCQPTRQVTKATSRAKMQRAWPNYASLSHSEGPCSGDAIQTLQLGAQQLGAFELLQVLASMERDAVWRGTWHSVAADGVKMLQGVCCFVTRTGSGRSTRRRARRSLVRCCRATSTARRRVTSTA